MMSLAHAILGFLSRAPMTGYDLKTLCFDQSVAHFWPADQAQIYRTLDKLTEQGFLESELDIQDTRPNRKVYSITPAGHDELMRWLASPQGLTAYREPFLVQLFFSSALPAETAVGLLEDQLRQHRERLAVYQSILLGQKDPTDLTQQELFERFTLDLGIGLEEVYIRWLEDCIAQLRGLSD